LPTLGGGGSSDNTNILKFSTSGGWIQTPYVAIVAKSRIGHVLFSSNNINAALKVQFKEEQPWAEHENNQILQSLFIVQDKKVYSLSVDDKQWVGSPSKSPTIKDYRV
jgi:hypothetical protein